MAAEIDLRGCPVRDETSTLTAEGRDRHLLRRGDGEVVHILNETARAIWELCDGQTEPREIVESIVALFDAPRQTVVRDVERALADLHAAGLLRWDGNGRREST
jgi:hypothetical protein